MVAQLLLYKFKEREITKHLVFYDFIVHKTNGKTQFTKKEKFLILKASFFWDIRTILLFHVNKL